MKINILIINILAIMFVVLIFIMALTFIIFHFQDASTSLKDTWSTTGSFFGGIATLTAAYIASKLFNDWKEEKRYDLHKEYIQEFSKNFFKINEINKTTCWWFIHFYKNYNMSNTDGESVPIISMRRVIEHDYSAVQTIIANLHNNIENLNLYKKYTNLVEYYEKYEDFFAKFCFINEELEKKYNEISKDSSLPNSAFMSFDFEMHMLNQDQENSVKAIILKIDKKIITTNGEEKSYEEAYNILQGYYTEIIKILSSHLDI